VRVETAPRDRESLPSRIAHAPNDSGGSRVTALDTDVSNWDMGTSDKHFPATVEQLLVTQERS
jgi:hypothetical protein